MKFYLSNPELDAQIAQIRRVINLSMNGIVSDQMTNSGIKYKKNYGVSIPRIKEIAKSYAPNHDLAQRLWALQIRETMILATLLEPIDKFMPEIANEWVGGFNQIEIIEQSCMNLFSKLPFVVELAKDWIRSENSWIQITGYVLAARTFDKFNANEIMEIVRLIVDNSEKTEFHQYKSMSLCLSRFCRKDKEIATYILKQIEPFSKSLSIGQQFIFTEVKQEILFLDIL